MKTFYFFEWTFNRLKKLYSNKILIDTNFIRLKFYSVEQFFSIKMSIIRIITYKIKFYLNKMLMGRSFFERSKFQ